MRHALVASQVALAVVMLAGAALLVRSLERLQGLSLGYNPDRLAFLSVAFPPSLFADSSGNVDQTRLNALGDRLAPVYRAIPGVIGVTPTLVPPFFGTGIFVGRLDREGQTDEEKKKNPAYPMEAGGGDYFRVHGIPIRRGRAFTEADDEKAQAVAVVSESAAQRIWPNENPIGKRIHFWSAGLDRAAHGRWGRRRHALSLAEGIDGRGLPAVEAIVLAGIVRDPDVRQSRVGAAGPSSRDGRGESRPSRCGRQTRWTICSRSRWRNRG